MALDEIAFYNTNGDEITISNIVAQMINYYGDKLEIGETRLTDFAEGSEIRNILEAFAIGIYALLEEQNEATRVAFIQTSYGGFLDMIGELPFINLPRVEGDYAKGTVTFTLSTAQSDDYTIPADSIVACSDSGLEFVTLGDCIISAGETTGEVPIEALTMGADGNVPASSIDIVADDAVDADLVSVTNTEATEFGSDYEDDEDYRTRLLENVQADGFGTVGYYRNLCESVDGVHDVLFTTATGYTRKILVNGEVKPTPADVLLNVLGKVTDLDNIVLNHSFTVDRPSYGEHTLAIGLKVSTTIPTTDLTTMINMLFNGGEGLSMSFTGCNINDSLTRDDIIGCLMMLDDVVEVTSITESGNEITTLTPATNGVLKLNSVSFTQTEV